MYWESERLIYRHATMSDVEALFRIYSDPRTHKFNPAGPHLDIEQSKASIERRISETGVYGFNDWAVMTRENPDHIIGFGGVFVSEYNGKLTNNLGYRFEPDAWGKGYATELSQKALHYGFREVGLLEIVGVVKENHLASKKVLEKAGMTLKEIIKNSKGLPADLMYRISHDEWLASGTG
jgi:RimJ/RimL family protein N-acetyltransferase